VLLDNVKIREMKTSLQEVTIKGMSNVSLVVVEEMDKSESPQVTFHLSSS